jgi:hypothetical protein
MRPTKTNSPFAFVKVRYLIWFSTKITSAVANGLPAALTTVPLTPSFSSVTGTMANAKVDQHFGQFGCNERFGGNIEAKLTRFVEQSGHLPELIN